MRESPSAPTFSVSRLLSRMATKAEKGELALRGLAPREMALSLVQDESRGNQPLFGGIDRQGQTCNGVGPQQGGSIVFSEDHQGDFALAAYRDPRLSVVQVLPVASHRRRDCDASTWRGIALSLPRSRSG